MNRSLQLNNLRDRVGAIQARDADRETGRGTIPAATGDRLRVRTLHEWFAGGGDSRDLGWSPPILPLLDLVWRGFERGLLSRVVWIGRRVFPYPLTLARHDGVLAASVFVDPPSAAARLWAIDLALRCGAPTAVIADGEGLTLPHTRRLQLAASAGCGIALLARPPSEIRTLSAATTRWRVTPRASSNSCASWTLSLIRSKDHPTLMDETGRSVVEWRDEEGCVTIPAVVERGAGAAAPRFARA